MAFSQTFGGLTIFLRIFEGRFLDFKDLAVWWQSHFNVSV